MRPSLFDAQADAVAQVEDCADRHCHGLAVLQQVGFLAVQLDGGAVRGPQVRHPGLAGTGGFNQQVATGNVIAGARDAHQRRPYGAARRVGGTSHH